MQQMLYVSTSLQGKLKQMNGLALDLNPQRLEESGFVLVG